MRTTPMMIAAAALLTASPAFAQNEAANAPATAAEANVAATNEAVVEPAPATVAEPATVATENTVTTAETTTEQPAKKSFPWGIVGILGLLGLIPRTRRS